MARLGDLGRYIVEFAFGDIYSRGGLGLREREMATVAMLIVLDRGPELRVHIGGGAQRGRDADGDRGVDHPDGPVRWLPDGHPRAQGAA